MAAFTCVPSPGAPPVACRGPGDVSTCRPENGASACKESDTKKTVAPFKVCYQAGEGVRPGVDVALWQRTFGRPPEERSCKVIPPQIQDRMCGSRFRGRSWRMCARENQTKDVLWAGPWERRELG